MAQNDEYEKWDIYTDSQAAIQAVNKPGRQSGQSIIKEFLDHIDAITDENPHLPITIMWISGHSEIEGNERADLEVKKAAIKPTISRPFHHRPLKSARHKMYQSRHKPPVGWTLERKYKNSPYSAMYAQTARRKDRKKVLQFHLKQKHSRDINTIAHRTLRIKSLSIPIQSCAHAILQLWICKRNSGTLSTGVPPLLQAKKGAKEKDRTRENDGWQATRTIKVYQTYNGVYSNNQGDTNIG